MMKIEFRREEIEGNAGGRRLMVDSKCKKKEFRREKIEKITETKLRVFKLYHSAVTAL